MGQIAETTGLLSANPLTEVSARKVIRVKTVEDLNDLAAASPETLERLINNWNGRKDGQA